MHYICIFFAYRLQINPCFYRRRGIRRRRAIRRRVRSAAVAVVRVSVVQGYWVELFLMFPRRHAEFGPWTTCASHFRASSAGFRILPRRCRIIPIRIHDWLVTSWGRVGGEAETVA